MKNNNMGEAIDLDSDEVIDEISDIDEEYYDEEEHREKWIRG